MADEFELIKRRKESPAGAGHYHVADRYPFLVRARVGDTVVATSRDAIILKEAGKSLYNPAFYFPRKDVDLTKFAREEGFTTRCPIKGEASYWTYKGPAGEIPRLAWSYDTPLPYSDMIAGHLGFDQRYVTLEIAPIDQQR